EGAGVPGQYRQPVQFRWWPHHAGGRRADQAAPGRQGSGDRRHSHDCARSAPAGRVHQRGDRTAHQGDGQERSLLARRERRMERCIPVDRLARPENFVLMRGKQVREIREEQGLERNNALPFDEETLRARLHGIYTGELQAMEAAGRTLFDFPDAPWEFQLDMARPVWDESRHSEIFQRLGEYKGAKPGDYVETEILWRCTQAEDPAARVAGINRGLEGLACDVFDQLIRIAQRNGDEVIERSIDYVLADEITHVRMGSKWMRKLTEG